VQTNRASKWGCGAAAWLRAFFCMGLSCLLCLPCGARADWQVLTNGVSGFNTPVGYANLRTVDFDANTLASQGVRIGYATTAGSGGFLVQAGSISLSVGSPALAGFTANAAKLTSGNSGTPASMTVQFNSGGTSYFSALIGMSVKQDNTQWVRVTYGSGTQVTLYNCKTASNANCLAKYVASNWLSDLISGVFGLVFGSNSYDSVYLTYTPPAGETINKVEFFDNVCTACAGFLANGSQDMWIDNFSYVDPTLGPHHLELTTTSATAPTGSPVTFTVRACANAACTSLYTTGMSGTLNVAGTGVTTTYPSGSTYVIGARDHSTTITATMSPSGTVTASLSAPSRTPTASPAVWCGMGVAAASGNSCNLTVSTPLHHLQLTSNAASTVTCVPVTYTIKACADASCSSLYTSAVSGSLSVGGTNVTPYSSAFSFSTGSTTVTAHMGTTGAANSATATASLTGYTPTPVAATPVYYGMGLASGTAGGTQTITLNKAGFLFDVKHHAAETQQAFTVSAVQSSSGTTACTPAFASVDKVINVSCAYGNPGSGTRAVRIQDRNTGQPYAALNAAGVATQACDGTGGNVTLRFDASGVASLYLMYADVGQVNLSARYSADALTMTGTDSFVSSPFDFAVGVTTAGNIKAGTDFALQVSARNAAGAATPNFGQESPAEGVTLSFVRTSPRFAGAVTGSLSGTLGAFANGVATTSGMRYTEVGKGDIAAVLGSANYLSAAKVPAGSTRGSWVWCANENGSCTLPTGATGVVSYGASGLFAYKTAQSGVVSCSNANFGDPAVGVAKSCSYVLSSGSNTAATGQAGPFIPHHFTVSTTNACNTFTYSGQPATAVIKAFNALDNVNPVRNHDGSDANPSYNAAGQVTLSDVGGATNGSWNGTHVVPASAFSQGVATWGSATYTFLSKTTAETTLNLRAVDTDGVSSMGYTEGPLKVRSGRLVFSNAYGSETKDLRVPIQVQYWSGKAWLINSADNGCTVISPASVASSNQVDSKGAAPSAATAWTTSAGAPITVMGGRGELVMQKPTLTSGGSGVASGSVDVAINLGNTANDNACKGAHPGVTGAQLSWLRASGSCGGGQVDPSARISFGVFSPETQRVIHVHDRY
jgi:hypothetical protein